MNTLSDNDITFIYNDLRSKGLTLNGLIDEMVDHICCIIEPSLEQGTSFQMAYNSVINNLDTNTFSNIQYQTILSTNLKFQNMKKSMIIFGVFGTALILTGTLFKSLHLPGASIGLSLGVLLTVFGFLPLFFYTLYKEQSESKIKYLSLIGYLTASCLLVGILFRVQHWPGTFYIMLVGKILLVGAFLPFYLVGLFKKAGKTNVNLGYIIIIVGIGIAALYMSTIVRISKNTMNDFETMNKGNLEIKTFFTKSNDSLFLKLGSGTLLAEQKKKIGQLKNKSQMLNQLVEQIENEMLKQTGNAEATVQDFGAEDNEQICNKVMGGYDLKLSQTFEAYKTYMLSIAKNEQQKYKLANHLEGNVFTLIHGTQYYRDMSLIQAIANLTSLQKNIVLAENEILTSL